MFKVKSHFIGSFKVGDNIYYNCVILSRLYGYFNSGTEEQTEEQKSICLDQ